eukprot:CAMPEP_0168328194 /NCGR_PEP_ID=MMETSP0213-20121227/6342_1 /TAXON_ID=151035 /ORGANISM="Euplotes harpa, Strain FSP1.4" /LENGTH=174 /DNA_ID=CAMNT_0008331231 /DNA_START=23 /DNA_END=544 /DNA_ORIENTATION=-
MSSRNYSPKERAISVTIIHKMNSVTIYDIYSDPSKPPQTPIPLSNLLSSHKKSLCLNPPYELTYFDFDNDPVKIRKNEDYLSALAYACKNSLFQLKLFVLPPGFEEEPQDSIAIRHNFMSCAFLSFHLSSYFRRRFGSVCFFPSLLVTQKDSTDMWTGLFDPYWFWPKSEKSEW